MDAVGADLGETMGNIIAESYKLMASHPAGRRAGAGRYQRPASRHRCQAAATFPIFHMEAGNRCKDECLPEETNRRIVDIISDVNMCLLRARPPLSGRRPACRRSAPM